MPRTLKRWMTALARQIRSKNITVTSGGPYGFMEQSVSNNEAGRGGRDVEVYGGVPPCVLVTGGGGASKTAISFVASFFHFNRLIYNIGIITLMRFRRPLTSCSYFNAIKEGRMICDCAAR